MYSFEKDNWCLNGISTDWSLDAEQDWYEISLPGLPVYMFDATSYIHPSTPQ